MARSVRMGDLAAIFQRIGEVVRDAEDAEAAWITLLAEMGQGSNPGLTELAITSDVDDLRRQLISTFRSSPFNDEVRFFYFGLFDKPQGFGYYVSGYQEPDAHHAISTARPPVYLPPNRFLTSRVLARIHSQTTLATQEHREVLAYAATLGAAAIVTRFAMLNIRPSRPVYAGFDSGDFLRVL